MKLALPLLLMVCVASVLLFTNNGRHALRIFKYEWVLGQPVINGVPRVPVTCQELDNKDTLIMVAFGQSNAGNYGHARYQPSHPVYSFYDGKCYVATDPLPGGDGGGGSAWIRLADLIIERGLAPRVLITNVSRGDSAIIRWAPGGDLNPVLLDTLMKLINNGFEPHVLLWQQGETDGRLGTRGNDYTRSFHFMLESIRDLGTRAPIYVAIATYGGGDSYPEIQIAQHRLANEMQGVESGPDADALVGVGIRYDDCHFSDMGLNVLAREWFMKIERQ